MVDSMICKSCGVSYDEKELYCPYCHSENTAVAKKIKNRILAEYDREAQELEVSIPKKAVKRWSKWLVRLVIALLIVAAVVTFVAVLWSQITPKLEKNATSKHIEKLEEFYVAEEWEEMYEYYRFHELYDSDYDKYYEVVQAYNYQQYYLENVEMLKDCAELEYENEAEHKEICIDWIKMVLDNAGYAMYYSRDKADDKVFLGNEKQLELFYNETVGLLLIYGYSDEELVQMMQAAADNEEIEDEVLIGRMLAYYMQ